MPDGGFDRLGRLPTCSSNFPDADHRPRRPGRLPVVGRAIRHDVRPRPRARRITPQLAPGRGGLSGLGRVVALDLPLGSAGHPRPGVGPGWMDLRRSLARFIDEAASGRVVVVGNSMGG